MKNKVEVVISVDQSGTLNINATGSSAEIVTAMTLAVIDITAKISVKRAKKLRDIHCALVTAAPVKADYTDEDVVAAVEEALNRVNGTSV